MTVGTVLSSSDPPFAWVDVVHPTSVEDSLEPEHLPKYERIGPTTFIIVRAIDTAAAGDCSTLHEMTRKVAIFYSADFLITIHRSEQPFLTQLMEEYRKAVPPDGVEDRRKGFLPRLVIDLINGAVASYQKPLEEAETAIDGFEATVFGEHEFGDLLRRIYLVRRRVTLMRRMLMHTLDAVKRLVPASEPTAPLYQDLRENVESMFFLPLTFVVGIYGMNFQFMPELRERWGYPAVMGAMGFVTLVIFLWFRKRGWLRG